MNHTLGNNPDDKHLIDRILRGDTHAFGTIVKNTERLVTQILFKMVRVPEDRKDLAQDIYLKVFHNLSRFRFQSKLSTWIAQIAYNTCLSWMEKKKLYFPGDQTTEDDLHPVSGEALYNMPLNISEQEKVVFQKEVSVILKKEIDALPPVYQTLITLFHNESMSYEELSLITGMPVGTIKSSLFRARKTLRENLLSKYQREAL